MSVYKTAHRVLSSDTEPSLVIQKDTISYSSHYPSQVTFLRSRVVGIAGCQMCLTSATPAYFMQSVCRWHNPIELNVEN